MVCLSEEVWFSFVEVIMSGALVGMTVEGVSELPSLPVWVFPKAVVPN